MSPSRSRPPDEILRGMSLEEKVGHTIYPGIPASVGAREFGERAVRDLHVGGFLLQRGGLRDGMALVGSLRRCADLPLLFASDMERGVGQQLAGATSFPANMAFGAAGDEKLAFLQGETIGAEAAAVGVDLVLAPVLDVHGREESPIVGTRSYGGDRDLVARLGAAFIQGCASRGRGTCAKHFPGHGPALVDSHEDVSVIPKGLEDLRRDDLAPFRQALQAGVDTVMAGHLVVEGLDAVPASLNPFLLGPLLREEMGFQGPILTDALLMGAITRAMPEGEAAVRALRAGADILLCPTDATLLQRSLLRAVKDGDLSVERLDDAVGRQLALKEEKGLFQAEAPSPSERDPESLEGLIRGGRESARSVAEASVCLLRDDGGLLPLRESESILILVAPGTADPWAGRAFIDTIARRRPGATAHIHPVPAERESAEWKRVEALTRSHSHVVWITLGRPGAWRSPPRGLHHGRELPGRRTVVAALGSPTLLDGAPGAAAAICSFSDADVSQVAAARAILGEIPFRGRLPIRCDAGAPGDGII